MPRVKRSGSGENLANAGRAETRQETERLQMIMDHARSLGDLHGLGAWWLFVVDNAKVRAGVCNFVMQRISISRHLILNDDIPFVKVENVILHEIAHALVGSDAGHGPEWKAKAIELGCDGKQYHTLQLAKPRGFKSCDCGEVYYTVHRLRNGAPRMCVFCGSLVTYKQMA